MSYCYVCVPEYDCYLSKRPRMLWLVILSFSRFVEAKHEMQHAEVSVLAAGDNIYLKPRRYCDTGLINYCLLLREIVHVWNMDRWVVE